MPNPTAEGLGISLFNDTQQERPSNRHTVVSEIRIGGNNALILRGSVFDPPQAPSEPYQEVGDLFLVLPSIKEGQQPNPEVALHDKGVVQLEADDRFSLVVIQQGDQRIPIAQATNNQVAQAKALLASVNQDPRLSQLLKDAREVIDAEVQENGVFRESLAQSVARLAGIRGTVDQSYISSVSGVFLDDPQVMQAIPQLAKDPFREPGVPSVEHISTKLIGMIVGVERFLLREVIDAEKANSDRLILPGQQSGVSFERNTKGEDSTEDTSDIVLQTVPTESISSVEFVERKTPITAIVQDERVQFIPYVGIKMRVGERTAIAYRVNGGILLQHLYSKRRTLYHFIPAHPGKNNPLTVII